MIRLLTRFLLSSSSYSCLKLYCQCFSLSTTCGPKCKCQTCHNTPLHPEAIEQARKTIMERNPSAFDDKFRSTVPTPATPSPYRGSPYGATRHPHASPPCTISGGSAWPPSAYVVAPSPPTMMATPSSATSTTSSSGGNSNKTSPPLRVNKFGCKCRRSFCLKKVGTSLQLVAFSLGRLERLSFFSPTFCVSIANVIRIPFIVD